ncbi:MAG: ATP synthase F0 subunit B, partial [Anaerovibrio sp.]|nr:ATP synthase F0 subunit B [Anaerovibrio sp.]
MIDINATLIAQMLNFLVLVVLLRIFAYKPIVKMLKEREERIAGSIKKADDDAA